VALKIKFSQYREYQRALAAYKDKVDKVDYAKRRAEQQARYETMKEERKSKDKECSENKKRMEARYVAMADGCQVYVGGLAIKAAEEDLSAIFEPFGTLTDVTVVHDNDTELSRSFSLVTYENEEVAKSAIKQYNRKENAKLCPPFGCLSIKIAEKSRQQKDWEKANRNKIIGKEPKETKEPKATKQEAGEEQEVKKEEASEEVRVGRKTKARKNSERPRGRTGRRMLRVRRLRSRLLRP
jgi:RNA recognition motif-containing protein